MGTYPTINWWEGNLRPYESLTLFITRFCDLNRTSAAQCREYLGLVNKYSEPENADFERIAVLLNENISVVRTVFKPSIVLNNCGQYCLPNLKSYSHSVRYCETCAANGYHSYLHETHWLSKCPFHMCNLKECQDVSAKGTIEMQRCSALKKVMQNKWARWPRADDASFTLCQSDEFNMLEQWVLSASSAARQLSRGQGWHSSENEITDVSLSQAIGMLRTLTPMPAIIQPLFVEIGEIWQLQTRRFPMQCKIEFERIKPYFSFSSIFDLYKRVGVWSSVQPKFVRHRLRTQEAIKNQHKSCHCRWGLYNCGWFNSWKKVNPENAPHWGCTCPYDFAVNELESQWGRANLVLSRRHAEKELFYFISQSYEMHRLGLIVYTKEANVSPEGQLYAYPQIWPCCEWVSESPLTALLNLAASFEVEIASDSLWKWLNAIDAGSSPFRREEPKSCLRLCEKEDGLNLILWSHKGTVHESVGTE